MSGRHGAAFAAYRMSCRAQAPQAEHITFADALRVAQTTSNVDPLSPEDEESADAAASKETPAGRTER